MAKLTENSRKRNLKSVAWSYQAIDDFAKSQSKFVRTVAELSAKSSYADSLHEICAVEAVFSLADNMNPSVRMDVVLILARLANHSEACVKQISCSKNQLRLVLGQIGRENKHYRKYSMRLIKNISKHSSGYDLSLIQECGVVDAISICLKDADVNVRESALLAVSSIVRHNGGLSKFIVNSGLLSPIIQCLTEKPHNSKLHALSALNEIAKHNRYSAQTVVDEKCLPTVIQMLLPSFTDIILQRSALALIKNIVKHSLLLSEYALESNLFSNIILLMAHYDETIRNNAVKVICEIVKKSVQIAQMVVNAGGIAALLNVISCSEELSCAPAVMALGSIAALSPIIALAIIQSEALIHLTSVLKNRDTDGYTKAGAVWTFGMIGKHSHEHARHINDCGAMTAIMNVYMDSSLENDSKLQCKNALQQLLKACCDDYSILEQLLIVSDAYDDPIMTSILDKISKILPKNTKARRNFIVNGHLKTIQMFKPDVESELFKVIEAVNCSFPEDILQMVAGDFPEKIMKTVDTYVPKSRCLFNNNEDKLQKSLLSAKNPPLSGYESTLTLK